MMGGRVTGSKSFTGKNPALDSIMMEHNLEAKTVAEMLQVSLFTVNNWRRSPESKHSALMSKAHVELLQIKVANSPFR
tara:strand:- start:2934 stop:3167 length:234 start_codon:yes stop_codon:yes gene_type:complete